MVYDAAVSVGVSIDPLNCMSPVSAWYSENVGLTIKSQEELRGKALDAVLSQAEMPMWGLGVDDYAVCSHCTG